MRIVMETIPHAAHRYPTIGDYWIDPDGTIQFRVSEMGDWRAEAAVFIHELWEALRCKHDGVSFEDIDAFDMQFEAHRQDGDESEPGDDTHAPYFRQHQEATFIERSFTSRVGLDWDDYEDMVNALA